MMGQNEKNTILKASFAVMLATLLHRMLGFAREMTLAATYGAGSVSDAFVIAMSLPTVVLELFTTSVSTLFIPQYTRADDQKSRFTNNLISILAVIGLVFAIIFTVFPQALTYLFAMKLSKESFDMATQLLRVIVWSSVPILLMAVLRGYLQVNRVFFIATALDSCVNVFIICAMFLGKLSGYYIILGYGAALGNYISLILLFLISRRKGLRYKPVIDFNDPNLRTMLVLMVPLVLAMSVREINQIVDKNFASSLVSGTISALNYSARINNVVAALLGTAIGTAMFPQISEYGASGEIDKLKNRAMKSVYTLIPLLLPLTAGMIILGLPVTRILLERGEFNAGNTAMTAQCLSMYSISLLSGNLIPLVTRAFYAMQKTKVPTIISAISLAVGIVLDLILMRFMAHRGLALATSVSSIINCTILFIVFKKTVGDLGFRKEAPELIKVIAATVVMSGAVISGRMFTPVVGGTYMQTLLWTAVIAGGGAAVYGLLLLVMRAEIMMTVISRVRKRT
ncbi:MAG: murein biosynthesis integral membrane protein MurJ [Clostridiales Family XIII bacterium]|jgi:putative peptidoglycan lipid II flippase|nr:murein biosynthesis integral membrane protein MurJ [Clostridiales Family XIII bacterium]